MARRRTGLLGAVRWDVTAREFVLDLLADVECGVQCSQAAGFGWHTASEYTDFVAECGFDVREWSGALLRSIRELRWVLAPRPGPRTTIGPAAALHARRPEHDGANGAIKEALPCLAG